MSKLDVLGWSQVATHTCREEMRVATSLLQLSVDAIGLQVQWCDGSAWDKQRSWQVQDVATRSHGRGTSDNFHIGSESAEVLRTLVKSGPASESFIAAVGHLHVESGAGPREALQDTPTRSAELPISSASFSSTLSIQECAY